MRQLIDRFANRRVLVVGDVMLDEYVWGRVSRISPEAPVPVVEVERREHLAGGAANVARNLSSLGASVSVVGLVGRDGEGERLAELFAESGVDAAGLIVDPSRPTTVKTRVIAHNQQVVRIDREHRGPVAASIASAALSAALERLPDVEAVVLSDYAKGLLGPGICSGVIEGARGQGVLVVVDPKGRDYSKYARATAITPNKAEAGEAASQELRDEAALVEVGRDLLRSLELDSLLITRGEEGLSLFQASGDVCHLPTFGRKVFDVTGAGDTVVAAFVLSLAAGASAVDAAYVANHAAGIVVGRIGAATVSPEELATALERRLAWERRRGESPSSAAA